MSALEARYRRALRWYPASWRADNEDAIVSVLLDGAADRTTPRVSELVNLAAHGLLARVAPLADVVPAGVRDATSSVALGFGFGVTAVILVIQEWAPWARSVAPYWAPGDPAPAIPEVLGVFSGWGAVIYLAWAVAIILLAAGARGAARLALLASVVASIVLVLVDGGQGWWSRPPGVALVLLASLAVLALSGNPLRRTPAWWPVLVAACGGAVAVLFPVLTNVGVTARLNPRGVWVLVLEGSGFGDVVIFVLTILFVLALALRAWNWAGAMVVMSVLWCAMSILRLVQNGYAAPAALAMAVLAIVLGSMFWVRLSGYRLRLVREPRDANAVD